MRISWGLPMILAVAAHGAAAVLPVVLSGNEQAPKPEVVIKLASLKLPEPPKPPEPEPPPPKQEPPKQVQPTPRKRIRQRRKVVPKPTPSPIPSPVPLPKPEPEVAKKPAPPQPEPPPKPVPLKPAAPRVDLAAYGKSVHRAVMRHIRYPRIARRLGLQGKAKVRIKLDLKGQIVGQPTIAKSSGHKVLDKAALQMVREAAPFATIPQGYARQTLTVVIPVRFKL